MPERTTAAERARRRAAAAAKQARGTDGDAPRDAEEPVGDKKPPKLPVEQAIKDMPVATSQRPSKTLLYVWAALVLVVTGLVFAMTIKTNVVMSIIVTVITLVIMIFVVAGLDKVFGRKARPNKVKKRRQKRRETVSDADDGQDTEVIEPLDGDTRPIDVIINIEQQLQDLKETTLSPLVAQLANETEPFEVSRPSEDSSFLQQILWELRQARLEARAFHEESMQQRERHHALQMDAIAQGSPPEVEERRKPVSRNHSIAPQSIDELPRRVRKLLRDTMKAKGETEVQVLAQIYAVTRKSKVMYVLPFGLTMTPLYVSIAFLFNPSTLAEWVIPLSFTMTVFGLFWVWSIMVWCLVWGLDSVQMHKGIFFQKAPFMQYSNIRTTSPVTDPLGRLAGWFHLNFLTSVDGSGDRHDSDKGFGRRFFLKGKGYYLSHIKEIIETN